jgi:methionyl-tRNA synthetase
MNNKNWSDGSRFDLLKAGNPLNPAEYLFEKIEDDVIAKQVQKLEDTKKQNEAANADVIPEKEEITFDDFQRMDIRVVTVLAAEKVAKTKKLLKLKVNTGIDTREIISGIAEHYQPEELVGKQGLMLVNLAPKNIKGVESHGMVLMAENADGSLSIMQPHKPVKEGSTVK